MDDQPMSGAATVERLRAERDAVLTRVAALTAELERHVAATVDSNADDEHDPEGATLAWERQQLAAARAAAERQVAQLDEAVQRAADGRYGRCERCGGEIGAERLAVLPATSYCVRCAR